MDGCRGLARAAAASLQYGARLLSVDGEPLSDGCAPDAVIRAVTTPSSIIRVSFCEFIHACMVAHAGKATDKCQEPACLLSCDLQHCLLVITRALEFTSLHAWLSVFPSASLCFCFFLSPHLHIHTSMHTNAHTRKNTGTLHTRTELTPTKTRPNSYLYICPHKLVHL